MVRFHGISFVTGRNRRRQRRRCCAGEPEGESVDAHLAGAGPLAAAGVVADALHFEEAGAEVADGVAADDLRIAGGVANAFGRGRG